MAEIRAPVQEEAVPPPRPALRMGLDDQALSNPPSDKVEDAPLNRGPPPS